MNIDNHINVVAGRPGAGKTLWAAREVVDCLRDENNIVLYIGFDQEFDRICRMVRAKYGNAPDGCCSRCRMVPVKQSASP